MWSYRLVAPYTFERADVSETSPDSLAEGQVLLRFRAAGVCGSDMPAFRGTRGRIPGDTGAGAAEKDGFPIHEIVGDVVASRHPDHRQGGRVVGWASGFDGLMELVAADASSQETRRTIERAESRQQALALLLMSSEFQRR